MDYHAVYDLTRSSPEPPNQPQTNIEPTLPTPFKINLKGKHVRTPNYKSMKSYAPAPHISSQLPPLTTPTSRRLAAAESSTTSANCAAPPCVPESPLAKKVDMEYLNGQSGASSPIDFFSSLNSGYDGDCDEEDCDEGIDIKEPVEYKQPSEQEMVKVLRSLKSIKAEMRRHTCLLRLMARQMYRRVGWKRVRVGSRVRRLAKRIST
ncbi:hypothetical protein N7533_013381 [Penicillium manginii]|uniref:uncharacterized protein n=1 Tax=Penicillium manginii TaxID=203109 RepID=UPI002548E7E8|nr:uncharacterized protein N7533_013381 [Penicillium manginii]KAJ5732934.1 hypothetical protein N7533_013381 [Penicillium manginii]